MRLCAKCNSQVADESRFCTTCGSPMAAPPLTEGGTVIATQVVEAAPARTVLMDTGSAPTGAPVKTVLMDSGSVPVQPPSGGTIESTKEDINKIFETSGVCPQCFTPFKKGSHICDECGYHQTGLFCKSCGQEVVAGQDFCPSCKSATVAVTPGGAGIGVPPVTGSNYGTPPTGTATVMVTPGQPPMAPPAGYSAQTQQVPASTPPYMPPPPPTTPYPPAPAVSGPVYGQASVKPPKAKSKAPAAILIVCLILLLGGGGFSLWYFVLRDKGTTDTTSSSSSSGSGSTGSTTPSASTATSTTPSATMPDNPLPPTSGDTSTATATQPFGTVPGTTPATGQTGRTPATGTTPANPQRYGGNSAPAYQTPVTPVQPNPPATVAPPVETSICNVSIDGSALRLPGMNASVSVSIGANQRSFSSTAGSRMQLDKGNYDYSVTVTYTNATTGEREFVYSGSGSISIRYPDQKVHVRKRGSENIVLQ